MLFIEVLRPCNKTMYELTEWAQLCFLTDGFLKFLIKNLPLIYDNTILYVITLYFQGWITHCISMWYTSTLILQFCQISIWFVNWQLNCQEYCQGNCSTLWKCTYSQNRINMGHAFILSDFLVKIYWIYLSGKQ